MALLRKTDLITLDYAWRGGPFVEVPAPASLANTSTLDVARLGAPFVGAVGLNAYVLVADKGAFVLTGYVARLLAGRRISAGKGAFVLTGYAALLRAARRLLAVRGSFSVMGKDVAFSIARPSPRRLAVAAEDRAIHVAPEYRAVSVQNVDDIVPLAAESRTTSVGD